MAVTESAGLSLLRRYFETVVEPLLPAIPLSCARIGDGYEVLRDDTAMSGDHNFGPSVQVLLRAEDCAAEGSDVMERLDAALPETFEGWPVRYESARRPAIDVKRGMLGSTHGVKLFTLAGW